MIHLDQYAYGNALRNVHPQEKFFFALATMIICLAANSFVVSLLVILLMAGVSILAGKIPLRFYCKLMLIPAAFLLVGTATIAINIVDNTANLLWGWQIFHVYLGVTSQSLLLAAKLFFRAWGAVSCLYFLSLTTPSVEIIAILRKLKVPELFLDLMSLTYRFLFVLMDRADNIQVAQTVRLGYTDIRKGYRSLGQLVANLFLHSYQRSRDLYTALEARGYQGYFKVLEREYRYSKKNLCLILCLEMLLILIAWRYS